MHGSNYTFVEPTDYNHLRTRAPTSGVVPLDDNLNTNTSTLPLTRDSPRKQTRKKKLWLWILLAVLVVVFAGVLVGVLVGRSSNKKSNSKPRGTAVAPVNGTNTTDFWWDPFEMRDNLTALGMYSRKRCAMLGPELCGMMRTLGTSVPAMRKELIQFWLTNGLDKQHGGFHGTLDAQGMPLSEPVALTTKGLVQQARHLWTFSEYHYLFAEEGDTDKDAVKAAADNLYKFLEKFLDKKTNLYVFEVSRTGVQQANKQFSLYGNWFAILALAKYAEAFKVSAAAKQARDTFTALDARFFDERHGGYSQLQDLPVLERGEDGKPVAKGQNTHLHGLEALTQLYKTTRDERVKQRLVGLLQTIVTKIFRPNPTVPANSELPTLAYAAQYFTADWKVVRAMNQTEEMVDHGHNLQFCWMILETLDVLGNAYDPRRGLEARKMALSAGAYSFHFASKEGDRLGFCVESGVNKDCGGVTDRVWWVQSEAMLALWKLYYVTSTQDNVRYLIRLADTLVWVSNNQTDTIHKEQFALVRINPDGTSAPVPWQSSLPADHKASFWKASYHSTRALMFLEAWMKKAARADGDLEGSGSVQLG